MNMKEEFLKLGEYGAAGLYEEPNRSLFYRKALGLRRYFEHCRLYAFSGEALYPSGTVYSGMMISPNYMHGLCLPPARLSEEAPLLAEKYKEEFDVYKSSVPREHILAGDMFTHAMPHYERILAEGLLSYIPRIEAIADDDLREGLLHLVEGIRCYASRCVAYLRSVSADRALIEALERVPLYPARNVYEAIVAWNFVMYLDGCDNLGCLAKGLLPYYRGEDLVPWLENLYDNLDKNNGYSMSLDSECPKITVQCLRAARGRRRPMIELLVDGDTPDAVWQEAFATLRSGGGQPAFYNKGAILGGLKARFPSIRDADLARFCGGGCTETMLAGYSAVGSLDASIHLLLIFERAMYAYLPQAERFEDFYEAYLADVSAVTEKVKREIDRSRRERAKYNPLPMRTLLIDDCIEKATEYNSGGARYNWSIISYAGMINVIDSLLAIKTLVFDQKRYTAAELLSHLGANDPEFLKEAVRCPESFGRDLASVNSFAKELSRRIFSMTETGKPAFGEGYLSASIQFRSQARGGSIIGATPDGRAAGDPLCDSLAAIFGKDSLGPTALLNSVTALDLGRALGMPVVNFNITQKMSDSILRALIMGYIQNGGLQLQLTYASREELLDAYEHPERHANLIVRVGGYSEYFCRLPQELQRMVIHRTVQGEAPV